MNVYSDPVSERHLNSMARVEAPERFPAAISGAEKAERDGMKVGWRSCQPASEEVLRTVHSPDYLKRLEDLSAAGGGYLNLDTALNSESWQAAVMASGAAIGAVDSALSGEVAFALARPPGHHAGRSTAMGFCLLNHAAVAAEHARSQGLENIAILDWDVHHGNGTQDIFYADGGVLYLSAHQSPFYPGTGSSREVGEGEGEGLTVNVALPAGSGEENYAAAFSGVFLPILREFGPELIIVSAGYDSHTADPLGGMVLDAPSYGRFAAELAALVRDLEIAPPAFILEGGYDLQALTESVAATMKGFEERHPVWEYLKEVRPVETTREALAPFWDSLR